MSKIDATVLKDGQLAIATVPQVGDIITGQSAIDSTCVVRTAAGDQLAVKTFSVGEGGGGGGGGADTSLSNLTDAGKIQVSSLSAPSDTYDDLTLGASGETYTMPADGYLFVWMDFRGAYSGIQVYNTSTHRGEARYSAGDVSNALTLAVHKGDVITVKYWYASGYTNQYFRFFYAKGNESEKGA